MRRLGLNSPPILAQQHVPAVLAAHRRLAADQHHPVADDFGATHLAHRRRGVFRVILFIVPGIVMVALGAMVGLLVLVGGQPAEAGLDAARVVPAVDVADQGVLGLGAGGERGARASTGARP